MNGIVKLYAGATHGVKATLITIEVNIRPGVHFAIVGLPDSAVKESIERIECAIINSKFKMPRMNITVNMAPADLKKEGSAYDLPIAIGILAASNQVAVDKLDKYLIMGELSLDGSIRGIKGALPIAMNLKRKNFHGFILPQSNALEAVVVKDLEIIPACSLREVVDFLNGTKEIEPLKVDIDAYFAKNQNVYYEDFAEVRGQKYVKRAVEIAAAGGHNVLMIGPPGSGKSMISKRIPTILPPLTFQEAIETTTIYSIAGKMPSNIGLITTRPFRNPHHTISETALVGGGQIPKPGEISLAHNGVLFLDELPEFPRSVLEVLRQPMEDKIVVISRAKYSVEFPCNFMLVASMNPCPCGYLGHPKKECTCSDGEIKRYLQKISGPLLDRIDIHLEVSPVSIDEIQSEDYVPETSAQMKSRIVKARELQKKRFSEFDGIYTNSQIPPKLLKEFCKVDEKGLEMLKIAMEKLSLSARAYDKILKVARTIADLDGSEKIEIPHLSEAIQYRSLDKERWLIR